MAHMLWTGGEEDADGLYLSLLSWVFTQNLGLDGPNAEVVRGECRPQLWVWVDDRGNKGMEEREEELVRRLVQSPWTAPFVTTRLAQSIRFQVWDTAKQLDAVPELADWRTIPALARLVTNKPKAPAAPGDANSEAEYNALTDVARLILPSRYGGAYVPPSTVFLRDWAELWNYRGQFGSSNRGILNTTPLLRLHRRSALSSFLLATGAAHGDFREEAIAKYLADARLEPLLFAAPGAMFDAGAQDAAFPVFRK
jgi:WD repeat and SOF domain-containing protein 1